MDPPAKRLRILQSVDVDETHPDYVQAKQKAQQRLKGRFESIFTKYESMHESMSDEIDMNECKIVVDRGHLRRMVRQAHRQETILLDNLGLAAGKESDVEQLESEHEGEDSEDELAPTETAKTTAGRKRKRSEEATEATDLLPSSNGGEAPSAIPSDSSVAPILPNAAPVTPDPAATLLQLVQFPQTPAGQQAKTSFYATLAQTINQAVQQAVAPLFSSVLSTPRSFQNPFAPSLDSPMIPVVNNDKITPAKDPKWFFPPLSVGPKGSAVAQSSHRAPPQAQPAPSLAAADDLIDANGVEGEKLPHEQDVQEISQDTTISVEAMRRPDERRVSRSSGYTRKSSPRVEVRHKPRRRQRYHFTEEDDIHLSHQRVVLDRSWTEIRASVESWKSWPLNTFRQRWLNHLEGRDLHLKALSSSQAVQCDRQSSGESDAELPSNHLPTPSSLGHADGSEPLEDVQRLTTNNMPSSSTHFDDDELDLLSLAGADSDGEQLPAVVNEDEPFFPSVDEMILPSVEMTDFVDEDALQQGLLDDSPLRDVTPVVAKGTSIEIKIETELSSPTNKRIRTPRPMTFQALADSETEDTEVEHGGPASSQKGHPSHVCSVCGAVYKTAKNLQRHQANPSSSHDKLRRRSNSIDVVGNDELQASESTTPRIKREFSTPPPISFLFSTPVPQSRKLADLPSSGVKSASGLSRKEYLKQVKQSWTKKSTPGSKGLAKRKSFHTLPRKQVRAVDASDDELGV
ncbi:hypothetical protein FB567DRAFT_456894 [Paraphoma chrysanthemicola]|uniref:C2H2-type domain-containing protein n=1 Tax=Paraphoma chrysanthemicola TaxID=798071 RepID=A0A8K0QU73_9PLEO|nr:hypothetical protein FB567DRAFT_456894 [Paraphoma chrysanthemicola]